MAEALPAAFRRPRCAARAVPLRSHSVYIRNRHFTFKAEKTTCESTVHSHDLNGISGLLNQRCWPIVRSYACQLPSTTCMHAFWGPAWSVPLQAEASKVASCYSCPLGVLLVCHSEVQLIIGIPQMISERLAAVNLSVSLTPCAVGSDNM